MPRGNCGYPGGARTTTATCGLRIRSYELRGVEITALAEAVGEAPVPARRWSAEEVQLPAAIFARKYLNGTEYVNDGRHVVEDHLAVALPKLRTVG